MSSRISQRIRSQLGDVVAVAAGQGGGERGAGGVGDQVTFAARPAPIDGASSGLGPPFNARIWEPSTAAREKSRAFALRSSARRTSWSRGHTPASVHSARRRQQVIPEPKPSSCGRCSQGFTSACCGSRHLDHHHRRHLRAPTGRLRRRGSSRRPDPAKRCEEGHKAPTTARRQRAGQCSRAQPAASKLTIHLVGGDAAERSVDGSRGDEYGFSLAASCCSALPRAHRRPRLAGLPFPTRPPRCCPWRSAWVLAPALGQVGDTWLASDRRSVYALD
jgi:hypothetical protein